MSRPAGLFVRVAGATHIYLIYGGKNGHQNVANESVHAGPETGEWNVFRPAGDNAHCFPVTFCCASYGMSQRYRPMPSGPRDPFTKKGMDSGCSGL